MALKFKPRARLLLQLGDQLIRSESIALIEVVKNSYDANASKATITMKNLTSPDCGEIIIDDDGDGMNADIIRNVWMQPGSEYKEKLIRSRDPNDESRIPIGGKGIGRFGVHKLGYKIKLISKMKGCKEVSIEINWHDFEQDKFLEDIIVELVEHNEPEYFTGNRTGTRIVISELKNNWDRATIRDLYRAINSLNSPFISSDGSLLETAGLFKAYFKLDDQTWLKGLTQFSDIENHALYYAEAEIENDKITFINYEFRPWDTMTQLKKRYKTLENIDLVEKSKNSSSKKPMSIPINLSEHKIGKVRFKILIFDRSPKILSLGLTDKKGFKDYLDQNGGIRVFRDHVRVYDYGEPGNDWLNLDIRRVNQPGKTISNNIIIGAINFIGKDSTDLIEKTNREGFIENEAYRKITSAINFTLDRILTQRNLDKEQVRKFYNPSAVNQPVIAHLKLMEEKVQEHVADSKLKTELLKSISDIGKDFEYINEIYTRSSSAGLSLSIVIHEVIHMITELAAAVEHGPSDSHVKDLVKTLQKTIGDYADIIKQSKKTKSNLIKVTDQALSNIQFRLRAHKVEIIRSYQSRLNINTDISCAQNLVTSTIINIIDNSIWWQTYTKVKKKKILVDIVEYPPKHISILIADNGPGFSIPTDEAIKPFISDKDAGMGLGLHLADEVMKGQKGNLSFPDPYDFDILEEFQNGAILLLSFRKMI